MNEARGYDLAGNQHEDQAADKSWYYYRLAICTKKT